MVHNLLSFAHDSLQMVLILKTLRIDLVDILGAGGSRGEPAGGSPYLEATARRRASQLGPRRATIFPVSSSVPASPAHRCVCSRMCRTPLSVVDSVHPG